MLILPFERMYFECEREKNICVHSTKKNFSLSCVCMSMKMCLCSSVFPASLHPGFLFFFSLLLFFFLGITPLRQKEEKIDLDSLIWIVHRCRRREDIEPTWWCHIIEFIWTRRRRKITSNNRRWRWTCIYCRIKRHLRPTWTWNSR